MLITNSIIRYAVMYVLLVFLQVTLLNNITIFNYAIPFLYIYLIIKLPISINRNLIVIIGFMLGFTIDIFCNTPGVNAAATTLAAFIRKPIQGLFFDINDYEELLPSLRSQRGVFVKWMVLLVFMHHSAVILLESFSFINIKNDVIKIVLSSILTCILILAIEGFSIKRKKN